MEDDARAIEDRQVDVDDQRVELLAPEDLDGGAAILRVAEHERDAAEVAARGAAQPFGDQLRDVLVVLDDEDAEQARDRLGIAVLDLVDHRREGVARGTGLELDAGAGVAFIARLVALPPHDALDRDRFEQAGEAEDELDAGADRQGAVGGDERAAAREVLGEVADEIVRALVLDEERDGLPVLPPFLLVGHPCAP